MALTIVACAEQICDTAEREILHHADATSVAEVVGRGLQLQPGRAGHSNGAVAPEPALK
jgi:hypothetical protein